LNAQLDVSRFNSISFVASTGAQPVIDLEDARSFINMTESSMQLSIVGGKNGCGN
jgi:hypothetical protein